MASVKQNVAARVTPETSMAFINAMAMELGFSRETILGYAYAMGLRDRRPNKLPPIGEVLSRLAAGETSIRIGTNAGVSKQAVYRALGRHGYRLKRGVIFQIEREAA